MRKISNRTIKDIAELDYRMRTWTSEDWARARNESHYWFEYPHAKVAGIMAGGFLLAVFLFSLICPTEAHADASVSIAWGWPVVMGGGDWDDCSGSTRLGLGYSWVVAKDWKIGVAGGVRIPPSDPHFVPRVGINAGHKVNSWFTFGAGPLYELIPAYEGGGINHFVGLGLSPTILTKSGVNFSLVTGPGVAFGPGFPEPLWTWVFQPQITLPF